MVAVLEKANFKMLLLVGDTYQIDAIQFGNWFSVLRSFLPGSAVFELKVMISVLKNGLLPDNSPIVSVKCFFTLSVEAR